MAKKKQAAKPATKKSDTKKSGTQDHYRSPKNATPPKDRTVRGGKKNSSAKDTE